MLSTVAVAQNHRTFSITEQPEFASSEDSIRYVQVNQVIRNAMEQRENIPDSLLNEFRLLRNRIKGFRSVYHPSAGFTPLDSLTGLADKTNIKTLSISNLKSRKLPAAVYACTELQELELVNTRIKKVKKLAKLPGSYSPVCFKQSTKRKILNWQDQNDSNSGNARQPACPAAFICAHACFATA
ncbi:MAG: hypothetical protein HWD62_03295 [Cyclobacteriaceae bacterium]|nr:MAG: hypothetical protein HWD62_03295 [Cyclobacteriaceae bacterium]